MADHLILITQDTAWQAEIFAVTNRVRFYPSISGNERFSMKQTVKNVAAVAMTALLLTASGMVSADGAALYKEKLCHTCHGPDAKTPIMPSYPKLAGQNADYAAAQVKDIRDGKRTNGLTMAMKPMVAALTDDQIKEIAAWLSTQ